MFAKFNHFASPSHGFLREFCGKTVTLLMRVLYIENTSWKVLPYGIYARVVDVSEIERVSVANE